jgi:hypothetical protein
MVWDDVIVMFCGFSVLFGETDVVSEDPYEREFNSP